MNSYDIVFIGHMATGTIVPFEGPPYTEWGSPVLFASIAAARLQKRIAAVTRITEREGRLLEPMRAAGVNLLLLPGEIAEYRVVFPTPDVDHRQPFLVRAGDDLTITDMPDFEPCLVHMCCIGPREFQLDLMRALKRRGCRLSVDMQNFVLQADEKTGAVHLEDVPEKKEILTMADFVKLDTMEALVLTGVEGLRDQAEVLESWGSSETVITCSEGVLVQRSGKAVYAGFTNSSAQGRMGRGDTVMGSYLGRRLDHSVEDSTRFAAALTSIKMEYTGPFKGSVDDVIGRMDGAALA